jgi:hypothetical protein
MRFDILTLNRPGRSRFTSTTFDSGRLIAIVLPMMHHTVVEPEW